MQREAVKEHRGLTGVGVALASGGPEPLDCVEDGGKRQTLTQCSALWPSPRGCTRQLNAVMLSGIRLTERQAGGGVNGERRKGA